MTVEMVPGDLIATSLGLGFLAGVAAIIAFAFFAAIYVYGAMAWVTIFRKIKYKRPWLAWIPGANASAMLQAGGFHWAWIFLVLIPFLGWIAVYILLIIASWRIFEKRKYPGWFSLSMVIPYVGPLLYLVAIGFVAWGKK